METILYVDDEIINLNLFRELYNNRFNVLLAQSGTEGLKILEEQHGIVAIICDMKMPGMSGIEFICKVREIYPLMPCMILSGYNLNAQIAEAMKKGIILNFMNKPFKKEALEKVVDMMIKVAT